MTNASSLVSVLIPTHNRAHYLAEALDSVIAQAYDPYEIILVDDGSTDSTREMAQRYSRLKYFYQPHSGVSTARNVCIEKASGSFVAFLDSDDYWLPGKLQAQMRYMTEHPDCQIVFTAYRNFVTEDRINQIKRVQEEFLFEKQNRYLLPSALIRRELFDRQGRFSTSLTVGEDTEFVVRLKVGGIQLNHYLPESYYCRRLHGDNLTLTRSSKEADRILAQCLYQNVRSRIHRDMKERRERREART